MTLIDDWKIAIRKFWSFRLAILAAALSAAEVFTQLWQPQGIKQGVFAAFAGMVSFAAAIARLIAQPKARK